MKPTVQFGVLGALAVWRGGELVTPRSATHRAVLAALLLAEGATLSAGRIVELAGSDDPPKNPRLWAQVAVSRLRTWLAEQAGDSVSVQFSGNGYRLVVPDGSVDLARFRQLSAAGRAEGRVDQLVQSLALWRGPVLADGPGGLRDSAVAAGLERLRLDAACALAETAIARGTPEPAVPVLGELVRDHPLDERLSAWWALVLAGCGRQADALAAIDAVTTRLAEELGVDPGAHLRQAQLRVLRQDVLPAVRPSAAEAGPAWRGPRSPLSAVIGREAQERELAGLLAERRLVTIFGPGGAGKTTVALDVAGQVAGSYPDGVAVLVLTPFTSADEIVMALGSLMDVTAPTAEQIRHTLGLALLHRRMLLVLDNCEHVAEASAAIVRWLLAAAPGITVLTTSRQPLLVPEEVAWALAPLAVPAEDEDADPDIGAVALFLRRAREALPSFVLGDGDLARIGRLCRRLDGLPLALELAAARVRALTVTQIADRLDTGYALLDGAGAGREARHVTLRSTLDWSYELLDAAERTLLARLSVFRGGCTIEAAEAICSAAPLTRDLVLPTLVALVDKSLVQPYDADSGRRFRLLETVAEFAAERLEDRAAVADRSLDHWLDRFRVIDTWPGYNDRARACRELAADIGNVRAAIAHGYGSGRNAATAELTVRGFLLWNVNGAYVGEGEQLLRRPAEDADSCSPEIRALTGHWLAVLKGFREDYLGSRQALLRALPGLAQFRPREYRLGSVGAITCGRFLLDPAAVEGCQAMLEAVGDDPRDDEPSTALTAAGTVYSRWGHFDAAAETTVRYAARAARRGTPFSVSQHVLRLEIAAGRGDLAEAASEQEILLARLATIGDPAEREPARRAIATLDLLTGRTERARDFLARTIEDLRRSLPPSMARDAHLLSLLGEARRRTGDLDGARESLLQSLSRALNGSRFEAGFLAVLPVTLLAADLGDASAPEELGKPWDVIRLRLGLPVPLGFASVAASVLGLDPAGCAPSRKPGRWDPGELRSLVERAQLWCARGSAAPEPETPFTDPW